MWMHSPPGRTVVAVVDPDHAGLGVGRVVATVPEGFHHPVKGYVGLLVMHRRR